MLRCSSLCVLGTDLAFEKEKILQMSMLMYNMNTQFKFDFNLRYAYLSQKHWIYAKMIEFMVIYFNIFKRQFKNIRGRSYVGTLYIRVSRTRENSTQIQHTVLLFKLVFPSFIEMCANSLAHLSLNRHRFLSSFFHSDSSFILISLMASLNLSLKPFLMIYLTLL